MRGSGDYISREAANEACRKLHYLGFVEKDGAWWTLREEGKR